MKIFTQYLLLILMVFATDFAFAANRVLKVMELDKLTPAYMDAMAMAAGSHAARGKREVKKVKAKVRKVVKKGDTVTLPETQKAYQIRAKFKVDSVNEPNLTSPKIEILGNLESWQALQ